MKEMKDTHYAPWIARELKNKPEFYKGIRQKTDTSLHEQLVDYIRMAFNGRSLKILDWGCGEGALAERLSDEGHDVLAVDMDAEAWKGGKSNFVQVNFNDTNSVDYFIKKYTKQFDLVLSVEVIEHIESPWMFLRGIRKFDCDLIVTTPNISSWWGRFWFLIKGDIWSFDRDAWIQIGHINPISVIELTSILGDLKFEIREVFCGGRLPIIWLYNWKSTLISIMMLALRPIMRGYKDGWVLCFHASVKQ